MGGGGGKSLAEESEVDFPRFSCEQSLHWARGEAGLREELWGGPGAGKWEGNLFGGSSGELKDSPL